MFVKTTHFLLSRLSNLLFIKRVAGINHFPKGGFILACNHSSYLDIWIVLATVYAKTGRYVRFIAKKELANDKHLSLLKKIEVPEVKPILIDRSKKGEKILKPLIPHLKKGEIVGIFPEGGRSRDGNIHRGKTGTIRLAMDSGYPIVALGLKGTRDLMPPGTSKPRIGKIVSLSFSKPQKHKKSSSKKVIDTKTNSLMKLISTLAQIPYDPKTYVHKQ